MHDKQVQISVSSLTEEEIDVDAFIADAKKLAAEQGLADSDIELGAEKPFPVGDATLILLGFATKVAYDIWKEFILPELKERYRIRQQQSGD